MLSCKFFPFLFELGHMQHRVHAPTQCTSFQGSFNYRAHVCFIVARVIRKDTIGVESFGRKTAPGSARSGMSEMNGARQLGHY
jgi:hypothetical protein